MAVGEVEAARLCLSKAVGVWGGMPLLTRDHHPALIRLMTVTAMKYTS